MPATTFDLVIKNVMVPTHAQSEAMDIGVRDGRVCQIGWIPRRYGKEVVQGRGLHALPGVIDAHVHMREPGGTAKEDMETGSLAAVMGGITCVFDMPNTDPPTVDEETLEDKLCRAQGRMYCDYAFYAGATVDSAGSNAHILAKMENMHGCCGVKLFMGSSTGGLLVTDERVIRDIMVCTHGVIAIHAEDEQRLRERLPLRKDSDVTTHPLWRDAQTALQASMRIANIAQTMQRYVHILHISSREEVEHFAHADGTHKAFVTLEVTPHHLCLSSPECYEETGTLAQVNPPIRSSEHTKALWRAVQNGLIDTLGSDHAPHTLAEKAKPYPRAPSGCPGVQTLVPMMLDRVTRGHLSLRRFIELTSSSPARIYKMANKGFLRNGYDADITIVDMGARRTVQDSWIASRCGWSPFSGTSVRGWPLGTIVRGHTVMWEGEITTKERVGEPVLFSHNAEQMESSDCVVGNEMA